MSFDDLVAIVRMTRLRAKKTSAPGKPAFAVRHKTRHERIVPLETLRARRGA